MNNRFVPDGKAMLGSYKIRGGIDEHYIYVTCQRQKRILKFYGSHDECVAMMDRVNEHLDNRGTLKIELWELA